MEAVSYIELIKDLAIHLHGTLTAIEIPRRMYTSIRHVIEAHCYKRPVPVFDAIHSIQMKNKSISVDLICIWPEDMAPELCEWDEILYEANLIRNPRMRPHTDPIACFSDIINTGYMLTMEKPKKIRMNAAAVHEMTMAVDSSSHMVSYDHGPSDWGSSRALVLNGVRLIPLPNTSIKGAIKGASAEWMTVDERLPVVEDDRLYRELNENPWTQDPWDSTIWKGQTEKPNLFDLEKEMDLLVKNLKG